MVQTDLEKAVARIDKLEQLKEAKDNELKRVKRANGKLEQELENERQALSVYQAIKTKDLKPPKWLYTPSGNQHEATPVQVFSDWHLGEVQPPDEVANYNAYSDKIAEKRMNYVANSSIKIIREFTAGLHFPGVVLPFAGDMVTGEIHDELTRNNAESVVQTVARWTPKIAAVIEMYAEEFGQVYVPWVTGNHSRRGKTMEHKNQAQDSYDWLIAMWLLDHFSKDDRVTMMPSSSLEQRFSIYSTKFLLTHGYFGGKGGSDSLTRVLNTRKRTANRDHITGNDFDVMIVGHYHTSVFGNGIIQCGCLKGLDVYAHDINVEPEPPSQVLFFTTPERGITMRTPVFAEAPNERKLWKNVSYYRNV
jgi:predicted phosphodiesterase